METFIKKNEMGIGFECAVVANIDYEFDKYVIYTNFVNDVDGNLKLFVGKLNDDEIIDVDNDIEKQIISGFKEKEFKLLKRFMEELK